MSELKPEKYRYWIALLLDDLPVGAHFTPHRLHITIVPWFVVDGEENHLLKSFYSSFANQPTFEVKLDKQAMFGPDHDVPVVLVEPHLQIDALHAKALDLLEAVAARWAVSHPHSGPDFKAHIRKRPEIPLKIGQVYKISSLSLIRASRRGDEDREVVAKTEFI